MDLGRVVGDVLSFIGGQIGASSLRLGPLPTLALLAVLLVLLSLVVAVSNPHEAAAFSSATEALRTAAR